MRLSEAILLGATMAPIGQNGDWYVTGQACGRVPTRCALELALLAVGARLHWSNANEVWPWLGHYAGKDQGPMSDVVGKFDFDYLNMRQVTLEQFVDWVRSVEPNEDANESAEQLLEEIRQQAVSK